MTPSTARKASASVLLRVERAARVRMEVSWRAVADRAARAVALGSEPHAVLVAASAELETELAAILRAVRAVARREGRGTYFDEMVAAKVDLLPLPLRPLPAGDVASVVAAAKALSGAWLASGTLLLASNDPRPVQAPGEALQASQKRLERTATTETARAFGDERSQLSDDYAEEAKRRGLVVPLKYWNASLDRTCSVCVRMHGTVRPFGVPFPDGQVPGAVHVSCHCQESILPLPLIGTEDRAA